MQRKNKTQQFDLKQIDPLDKQKQLDEERLLEYIKQRLKIDMSFGKGVHMIQIS